MRNGLFSLPDMHITHEKKNISVRFLANFVLIQGINLLWFLRPLPHSENVAAKLEIPYDSK